MLNSLTKKKAQVVSVVLIAATAFVTYWLSGNILFAIIAGFSVPFILVLTDTAHKILIPPADQDLAVNKKAFFAEFIVFLAYLLFSFSIYFVI